jgi:hypothetical protein
MGVVDAQAHHEALRRMTPPAGVPKIERRASCRRDDQSDKQDAFQVSSRQFI